MKWHENCHYMELPRNYELVDLARFHGHLGPYIVLGYRMGRRALNELGGDPFSLNAEVYCTGMPPQSCLADGVQLGSGCTLGKGNVAVIRSDDVKCHFYAGEQSLTLKPLPLQKLNPDNPDYELEIERYAESLYHAPDDSLFRVE